MMDPARCDKNGLMLANVNPIRIVDSCKKKLKKKIEIFYSELFHTQNAAVKPATPEDRWITYPPE